MKTRSLSSVGPLSLFSRVCLFSLGASLFAFACDSTPAFDGEGGDGDGTGSVSGMGGDSGKNDIDFGSAGSDGNGASSGDGDGDGGPVCENVSSDVELAPIFLAFAFDVSGSMGQYDRPQWWHDPDKKWKPVVDATTAFFEDAESEGVSASMGLFPAQGDSSTKCDSASYGTPEVTMTALPSNEFSATFSAYEAEVSSTDELRDGNWRGGTPTLAAFGGTAGYLSSFQAANPDAKFAVVLVTDGTPQGCGGDDAIGPIATAAETLYDGGAGVPTYVIGIENPETPPSELPDGWADWGSGGNGDCTTPSEPCTPPNALADLHAVAEKGGTTEAFLIDTADPAATKANFRKAIDAIRTKAISCELPIPAHPTPGKSFDKDKIDVTVTVGSDTSRLDYDPTCEAPDSWHYDDEDNATEIILCPDTCTDIQSQPGADLNVDFLCEDRPIVIH